MPTQERTDSGTEKISKIAQADRNMRKLFNLLSACRTGCNRGWDAAVARSSHAAMHAAHPSAGVPVPAAGVKDQHSRKNPLPDHTVRYAYHRNIRSVYTVPCGYCFREWIPGFRSADNARTTRAEPAIRRPEAARGSPRRSAAAAVAADRPVPGTWGRYRAW